AEGQLNLELIKRYAKNFIPVLFNAYEGATSSTSEQYAATVHNAAAAYLGIAPVALVTQYFGRLESLLTQATAASGKWTTEQKEAVEAERVKASSRLGLALAITPRLEPPALASLYRIIRPAIQDDTHSSVQKRAYKVLLAIVMANPQFALAPERRDDILGLLRDSLVT
ncbi:RRP12, partial [Symbiodinium sp. KB8]